MDELSAAQALADQCVEALNDLRSRAAFFDRLIQRLLPLDHKRIFWGNRTLALGKNAGFLDDPRFAAAFQRIHSSQKYDQYDAPQSVERTASGKRHNHGHRSSWPVLSGRPIDDGATQKACR